MDLDNQKDLEIESLRHENEFLKHEIEFLRKNRVAAKPETAEGVLDKDFKIALDNVSDLIVIASLDGDMLYANLKFGEIYNVDVRRYKGKVYDIINTLNSREAYLQRIAEIRKAGGALDYQSSFIGQTDQKKHTFHVSASIINNDGKEKVSFFTQDITPIVESRDEFRELNYLLDAILSNIPVYLFVKDVDNDLRYLYWNKAFAEYSKIPAYKVIGKTDYEVFPVFEDAQKFRDDDMELLQTGEAINRHETYEAADGSQRIVQTLKTLVPRKGRGPLLIGVSWDITNMQDIEKELIQERIRAEQSDRLKSLFLANMSHEIRTPLNAIVGFSQLLTNTDDEDDKTAFCDIIQQNSNMLLQLISDILDLSKIEAGTLEYVRAPVNIKDIFHNVYETLKGRADKHAPLVFDEPNCTDDIIVNEDRNRITQVLTNLINNAIKFTKEGSIHFGYQIKDGVIEAYVSDTGIGIAPDKLEQIFERFVKLNNFAQGTGLGLSICRVILDAIGGKIWAESTPGNGTTFRFTIPYVSPDKEEEKTALQEKASEPQPAQRLSTTILVAEDVRSNYLLIRAMIGKKYNLLWAQDGLETVEMYEEHKPDLILMDVKMPEVDGLEATRRIRAMGSNVPIIALTAFAFEADKKKAFEAGVDDYLTKPVDKKSLEEALARFL